MKKVLIIAIATIFSSGLIAQGETSSAVNKMWLGGNVGFKTNNVKDGQSSSDWSFGPTFAYMFNDKMAVGVNTAITGSTIKQNNNSEDVTKRSGWYVEPFYRYYFAGAGNFKFFGDALVGFGGGKTTMEDNAGNNSESKYSNFGLGVRPGFQFWFNDSWSIASTIGVLGYGNQTDNKGETDPNGDSTETVSSGFNFNVDFSTVNFSFFWHF